MIGSHTSHGWAASLYGEVRSAAADFALANTRHKKKSPYGEELYGLNGIQWAELLVRSGHPALASRRTQGALLICERVQQNDDIARCHWMLGWCALAEGKLDVAEAELRQAE